MNIAYFIDQKLFGGVDVFTDSLLKNWSNKDTITLYINKNYSDKNYLIKKLSLISHIKIREYYSYKWNKFSLLIFPFSLCFITLYFYCVLRNKNHDIFMAQNGCYPGSYNVLSSIIAANCSGIKVKTMTVHHESVKPAGIAFFIHPFLDRIIAKLLNCIITVSRATLQSLKESSYLLNDENININVIHNGIEYSNQLKSSKTKIKEFKDFENKIKIGMLSRVEPYKGHSDVLEAISKLPQSLIDKIHFIIVGNCDNNNFKILKTNIDFLNLQKTVSFFGFLENQPVEILSNFDIFISATRTFEGFGLSLAQAISCGIPIISTNVGAIPEYLNSNDFKLVNPYSSELSEALLDMLTNFEKHKVKAIKSRNILSDFSEIKCSKSYQTLHSSLFLNLIN